MFRKELGGNSPGKVLVIEGIGGLFGFFGVFPFLSFFFYFLYPFLVLIDHRYISCFIPFEWERGGGEVR